MAGKGSFALIIDQLFLNQGVDGRWKGSDSSFVTGFTNQAHRKPYFTHIYYIYIYLVFELDVNDTDSLQSIEKTLYQ